MNDLSLKTTHIGSIPLEEAERAVKLVFDSVDIPAWPQLSKIKKEGMLLQFNEGFPGFNWNDEKIEVSSARFEEEMLGFYEAYLQVTEENKLEILENFALSEDVARGFKAFLELGKDRNFSIVKGQITGPFTLATALKTDTGEIPLFRDDLRDLITKFVAIKALAQGIKLKTLAPKVIIFMDEPGLVSFGSSAFITISKNDVITMLNEIANLLKKHQIIPGIHVCANTSWDVVLESEIEILNFDSFNFYDKFIIYDRYIKNFLEKENKYIAWGVIPTDREHLGKVNLEDIYNKFKTQLKDMSEKIEFSEEKILEKSLITPACGMGSLDIKLAEKGFNLLKSFKNRLLGGV